MPKGAVSILRVSTKKQLNDGDGIENQRRGNTEYIRRKGYQLVREFVIAETAEGPDREDFETAIRHVIAAKAEVDVVVFWKVDRISRGGVVPYYTLKGVLAKHGIRVEFATEQIDGSPTGELMETLLAGMARFENRLRVERTIGVEKILTMDGYWCRAAPTGFRNGRLDGKPVLLPSEDEAQWELLRHGLRKQMTGAFTLAEVTRELQSKGLRTRKGNPLCKQTWQNICRSPVYGGLLCGPWTGGAFVRAKFDGPLTPEEWRELQQTLDGKKRVAAAAPRQELHPDFPLRRFVRCPRCGKHARGYHAIGRHGRAFAYYDCQHPVCGFRVRTYEAHDAFVALLRTVTPEEPLLVLFRAVVLQVWEETLRELDAGRESGRQGLTRLEEEKGQLLALMKRAARNSALLSDLEKDYERVEKELSLLRVAGGTSELEKYDPVEVVETCFDGLRRIDELWLEWPVEAKSRIQRLVFPEGVYYDALLGNRTPQLSLLYGLIRPPRGRKTRMAPHAWRVTNSILEEMIEWYNVLKSLPLAADATCGG